MVLLCFVLFKEKTVYEMRISDWSSDVCSSDLRTAGELRRRHSDRAHRRSSPARRETWSGIRRVSSLPVPLADEVVHAGQDRLAQDVDQLVDLRPGHEIGRASGRDRVCQDVYISVVARALKKHKPQPITN